MGKQIYHEMTEEETEECIKILEQLDYRDFPRFANATEKEIDELVAICEKGDFRNFPVEDDSSVLADLSQSARQYWLEHPEIHEGKFTIDDFRGQHAEAQQSSKKLAVA